MVIRLGARPGHGSDLAGAGYRRILQGQTLQLHTISGAAVALRAWVRVIYDDGSGQLLTVPETVRSASRVAEVLASTDVITQNGWVVNAEVEMLTSDIKRGQTYVRLAVEPFGCVLLQDYCFSGIGNVSLGTYTQAGPGGGSGSLEIVTVKADSVPVTTTHVLAASNTIRKIYTIVWYYNASADVDSRVLSLQLQRMLGSVPTGFTEANNSETWRGSGLTLTASEEGTLFADEKRFGANDNGSLTYDSNPSPFPLLVQEDSLIQIVASTVDLNANDRDAIYLLREEWVLF